MYASKSSLPFLLCGFLVGAAANAQSYAGADVQPPLTSRERALLERVELLERRVAALEAKAAPTDTAAQHTPAAPAEAEPRASVLSSVAGTTFNLYLDGYYGWNANRPVGRVNLLRANDVLSNGFSVNQAGLILERAPDVAAGRRYGARIDLMFGQNTETLQGGAQNEPRPQAYRNLFQAYGTYVFPLGGGVTVDFGKFYSALGMENNYAYDEMNYSRSFWFTFLPFYHTGFRSTYNLSEKLAIQHWLVNGANQTEDFNGFKSNAVLFTLKPAKNVSWNLNYYAGREGRDLVPAYNPELPALPTQPGLSITPAPGPRLNGRSHIFDTYASWSPAGKLTLAGEFDHVLSRAVSEGPPSSATGGAAYLEYRFAPEFRMAGRFEYLRDRGGLFSGLVQELKEYTVTATYQPVTGVQARLEYRRDFSDRQFFLTRNPGILKKEQNTATLGLIWWFGGKRESW